MSWKTSRIWRRIQRNPNFKIRKERRATVAADYAIEPLESRLLLSTGSPIVLDVSDSGVTFTGRWWYSSTGTFYGTQYTNDGNQGKGEKSVQFNFTLPAAGTYDVSIWNPSGPQNATNVPVNITTATGITTITLNEQQNGAGWLDLGNFTFGDTSSVVIGNAGTQGLVTADAVQFTPVSPPPLLAAPANFAAGPASPTSAHLSWTEAAAGVTGFLIQESTDDLGWMTIATAAPTALTYTVNQLTAGDTYDFRIQAQTATATSAFATTGSVALPAPNAIVQDVDSPGLTFTGRWWYGTSGNEYGTQFVNDGNQLEGTKSVQFTPQLPGAGTYSVYAWWPAASNYAPSVPVTINAANGAQTISVNETTSGGQWVSLGTYSFNAGGTTVIFSNAGAKGFVVADAIEFVPLAAVNNAELQNAIAFAGQQLNLTMTDDLDNNANLYPNYTASNGTWVTQSAASWTSGAFPASLWEMYQLTGNPVWETDALKWTAPLAAQSNSTSDTFLTIYAPFLADYEETGSAAAKQNIINSALARVTNFNATVGAWQTTWRASTSGNPAANFGVLLDQSMDTQEVFWAAQQTGDTALYNDAVAEMNTVAQYLVRPNGSTWQWGYFNSQTGQFIDDEAYDAYSDTSTWSRGQAWAIYSFTSAYQFTGQAGFLTTAEAAANYFISNLPSDSVPYWDFNAPGIPNTFRDTSAAAIAASGLLTLAKIDPNAANAQRYYNAAVAIVQSLAGPTYLAQGSDSHGILLQGDGAGATSDIAQDSSLVEGDYFFLQAVDQLLTFPTA